MYLDVSLAVDVHVDDGAEPDQTLPHFHIADPRGQKNCWFYLTVDTYSDSDGF